MVKKVSPILLLLFLLFLCGSWGEKAHRKINSSCVEFFPKELTLLKIWAPVLADHGSDADSRKRNDPDEFVRHFIDIDLYDEFTTSGKIIENFDSLCTKYGRGVVMKYGTLPWVTDSTYQALVENFRKSDLEKAVLTAADLGHYVGDGFMPLHISGNFDGQLTGQKGIHRRYEETMIDQYISQVTIKPSHIGKVKNVQKYVFGYLYRNHVNNNLLLQADKQALEISGGEYNDVYYVKLWESTNQFTSNLLQEASKTLASLIYSAWLEAGKPTLPGK
jgi:hypothetical protein